MLSRLSIFALGVFALAGASLSLTVQDAAAMACAGTSKVVRVAPWDTLNMRTGPGTGFQIIKKLAPGEGCIIRTGESHGSWVRVNHAGNSGWVHGFYLGIVK